MANMASRTQVPDTSERAKNGKTCPLAFGGFHGELFKNFDASSKTLLPLARVQSGEIVCESLMGALR
jgi:hypothetical protein